MIRTRAWLPLLIVPLLLAGAVGCAVIGPCGKGAGSMTLERRAEHLASFDHVWQTINDRHYDPTFNGVDWNAVRAELRPKMERVATDTEAEAVLNDLVHRLKLSHFGILAPGQPARAQLEGPEAFVPALAKEAPVAKVKFGNLPELPLRVTSQRLPSNVGYFYLGIFLEPSKVMPTYRQAVDDAREMDGLIIDLRHNPGGLGAMATGMANALIDKPGLKLGTMIQREGDLNFVLNPQADPYTRPVAVLIDGQSGSTSEIFAQGMRDAGRAKIFGTCSAGQALPSYLETLPNGYLFQYAIANYISAGGKTLEGNGVTPDEVAENPKPGEKADPVVEAAVAWIKSQAEKKQ